MATVAGDALLDVPSAKRSESVRAEAGHIAPLDGLRGIAVLLVVVFHACAIRAQLGDPWVAILTNTPGVHPWVGWGHLGVDLFFLLSGFLLTLPWFVHELRGAAPPSAREFYKRRFLRIAPAHYVQLVLLFTVVLPLLKGSDYWRRDLYVYAYNLIAHAGFLHNFSPLTSGSMQVNGALWTLAIEAQYYLLIPLLAPIFVRRPIPALIAAFLIAAVWRVGAHSGLDSLVAAQMALGSHWGWPESTVRAMLANQLPSYFGHFAFGIVLGGLWLKWREQRRSLVGRRLLDAMALISLGAFYWVIAFKGELAGGYTWVLVVVALGGMLFWAAANNHRVAHRMLGRGPLAFLGRISYSVYLLHVPLLLIWSRYGDANPGWLSLPLFAAVLLGLSWLSWRYVEQPFVNRIVSGAVVRGRPRYRGMHQDDT